FMSILLLSFFFFFFLSSRRRHTRFSRDWSSDVCSSDLVAALLDADPQHRVARQPSARRPWKTESCPRLVGVPVTMDPSALLERRSEERRVGKECRSRGGG